MSQYGARHATRHLAALSPPHSFRLDVQFEQESRAKKRYPLYVVLARKLVHDPVYPPCLSPRLWPKKPERRIPEQLPPKDTSQPIAEVSAGHLYWHDTLSLAHALKLLLLACA
ncbi:unnamed protein product [Zymoseptoria tritici ST99CH_3D7]|uniref:Uncharacterized protein n=1 Tax=Zymoseptoria tritici (strain ST99CH_3D7) TaxID=1276538 RepID=A0A1X7RLJ2_ZYMT9|nr:unnamed protein product [Zymoseptoria tritici ST99CH_3D7]